MKSTGYILKERVYVGGVSPPNTYEDESRFGNDGSISGVTWLRLPSGLWVRSFDGNDLVNFGNVPSLSGMAELTVKVWVKTTIAVSNNQTLFGIWDALDEPNQTFLLDINGGTWRWAINSSAGAIVSGGTPVINTWHFVVGTYKTADYRLAVDLVEVATGTSRIGNLQTTTEELLVGCAENNGYVLFWTGQQGLLELSSYVWSPEKKASVFQAERHWFGV